MHDDFASDYNHLLQQFTTNKYIATMCLYAFKTVFIMVVMDKLTASKKEQQRLQSSLEQWQRMGRARDQQMLKLKNENEVLQSKCK